MKYYFLTFSLLFIFSSSYGQDAKIINSPQGVVISNNGGNDTPYSASILDVRSTTKGVLLPRMSTTNRNAIASPQSGLMIYNSSTNQFNFHDGAAWQQAFFGNQWNVNGTNISYSGGRVGIGTNNPLAQLAVDSSLMVDQRNSNLGNLNNGALYFGSDRRVGIIRSFLNGSSGRNGIGFFTNNTRRVTIDSLGRVGINTISPLQALHVTGSTYVSGYLGIGSSTPDYSFENFGGYNYMYYSLGVGTTPNSSYLIDVGTSPSGSRFQGNLRIDGTLNPNNTLNIGNNATIDGTLTVNNGKGVAYNSANSTNLRIHRFTTETATAILGPHGRSGEFQIAFNGGFTSNPTVLVGDIYTTGGTAGDLFMVDLVLYGCSTASGTTTCDARLVNKSAGSVNYSIRWNCVAIGY